MSGRIKTASIFWDDEFGIHYRICRLDYEEWEDGSFEYRFTPDYNIIDMLDVGEYGGIPGLNLDHHRDVYIRRNMEPVFMTERSPSRNRVDVRELMKEVGLDHYDRLEWLIRTHTRYVGDDLYVERYSEPAPKSFLSSKKKDLFTNAIDILSALARGSLVTLDGRQLTGSELSALGRTLRMMLHSDRLANTVRVKRPTPGRSRKELSPETIEWVRKEMDSGTTGEMIAKALSISRSTLYRRLKESGTVHMNGFTCR